MPDQRRAVRPKARPPHAAGDQARRDAEEGPVDPEAREAADERAVAPPGRVGGVQRVIAGGGGGGGGGGEGLLQRLEDAARVAVDVAADGEDGDLAVRDVEAVAEERAGHHARDGDEGVRDLLEAEADADL